MNPQTWKARCFAFFAVLWMLLLIPGCQERSQSEHAESAASSSTSISRPANVATTAIQHTQPVPQTELLPSGVVLHLSFDIATICKKGSKFYVKDLSGNGHDGFLRNVTPAKGKFGAAANFNGTTSSKVSGPDASLPSGSSASTISVWFNARKPDFQFLFTYGTANSGHARGLSLVQSPGICFFSWGHGDALLIEPFPFKTDQWHHFATTCDGESAAIYFDGEKKREGPYHADTILSQYIVGKGYEDRGYFDGLIDDVIVFNRALTASEIKALYHRQEYSEPGELSYASVPTCN